MSDAAHPIPLRDVKAPKERPGPLEYMRRWPLRVMVGGTLITELPSNPQSFLTPPHP